MYTPALRASEVINVRVRNFDFDFDNQCVGVYDDKGHGITKLQPAPCQIPTLKQIKRFCEYSNLGKIKNLSEYLFESLRKL